MATQGSRHVSTNSTGPSAPPHIRAKHAARPGDRGRGRNVDGMAEDQDQGDVEMGPRIFISHIHEDDQPALYLVEFLRKKLEVNHDEIFVSSNQQIDLGSEWFQTIGKAFLSASVVIALFSGEALRRQWVHFEAGGAFFHGSKCLIPLCIGGLKPVELGKPYANIQ